MIQKRFFATVLSVMGVVTIFYIKLLYGFFQHDEWQTFATKYLQIYSGALDVIKSAFLPQASHYDPFFELIFNFLFSVFEVNFFGYAATSLGLHLFSVLLVFLLVHRLTKKLIIATMSASLFGLNASTHQATSWIIANINTHGATIFGLLSIITFSYFLSKNRKRNLLFLVSLAFLVMSLLFKEITIAFFVFFPLILWLCAKVTAKRRIVYCSIILGLGILYLGFRLFMFSLPVDDSEYIVTRDQKFTEIAYNTLTFPAKIFAQSTIPTWQLSNISRFIALLLPDSITGLPGTTQFDRFAENRVLQVIDFFIFMLIVTGLLFILKSRAERSLKRVAIFSFIFAILNSFIYALSPGRSGYVPVIDSRNIYLPTIGTSIFIIMVIYIIARGKAIRAVLIFVPLIFLHLYWLNQQLEQRVEVGTARKNILQQIKREYPILPEKVVFYVESDTAYYGMAENIPPFETGLGQALLVWYHATEQFPTELFENRFLRFITDQGYRESGGRGFGYFRDFSLMKETIEKNNLSVDSVISYNYYGKTNVLQESTAQTREKLIKLP